MTELEQIRANAALTIELGRDRSGRAAFGYDRDSIAWLDQYIGVIRGGVDQQTRERLISMFGSFLGECLIHRFGGEWNQRDGAWAVFFMSAGYAVVAYPFSKVSKRFANGEEDSILSLFDCAGEAGHMFVKKPWWKFW